MRDHGRTPACQLASTRTDVRCAPLRRRLAHHLLWNVIPTLLLLLAVGWASLKGAGLIEELRRSRPDGQRTAVSR